MLPLPSLVSEGHFCEVHRGSQLQLSWEHLLATTPTLPATRTSWWLSKESTFTVRTSNFNNFNFAGLAVTAPRKGVGGGGGIHLCSASHSTCRYILKSSEVGAHNLPFPQPVLADLRFEGSLLFKATYLAIIIIINIIWL